jgi:hypothetical protein
MKHTWKRSNNAYRILLEKLEGKRHLRRCGKRWDDNIKIYL